MPSFRGGEREIFGDLTSNVRAILEVRESEQSARPNAPQEGCLGAGMVGCDG